MNNTLKQMNENLIRILKKRQKKLLFTVIRTTGRDKDFISGQLEEINRVLELLKHAPNEQE